MKGKGGFGSSLSLVISSSAWRYGLWHSTSHVHISYFKHTWHISHQYIVLYIYCIYAVVMHIFRLDTIFKRKPMWLSRYVRVLSTACFQKVMQGLSLAAVHRAAESSMKRPYEEERCIPKICAIESFSWGHDTHDMTHMVYSMEDDQLSLSTLPRPICRWGIYSHLHHFARGETCQAPSSVADFLCIQNWIVQAFQEDPEEEYTQYVQYIKCSCITLCLR